jgi:PspA-Associated protein
MIVRVQGSGQYRLAEGEVAALDDLDRRLVEAVRAQDGSRAHRILDDMISLVLSKGTPVGVDELVSSDTVLPHDTITLQEVETLLKHESLAGAAKSAS